MRTRVQARHPSAVSIQQSLHDSVEDNNLCPSPATRRILTKYTAYRSECRGCQKCSFRLVSNRDQTKIRFAKIKFLFPPPPHGYSQLPSRTGQGSSYPTFPFQDNTRNGLALCFRTTVRWVMFST